MTERQDRVPDRPAKDHEGASELDLRGLKCPLPALRTRKALANGQGGARFDVLADDPLARLDIAHLCRSEGHDLLAVEPLEAGGWRFRIRARP